MPKNLADWKPLLGITVSEEQKYNIIKMVNKMGWGRNAFHNFYKNIEINLIKIVTHAINNLYEHPGYTFSDKWIDMMRNEWYRLSLLRDIHDFICGRHPSHRIRIVDCYKFMNSLLYGMYSGKFNNSVRRIFSNTKLQYKFKHPLFKEFN